MPRWSLEHTLGHTELHTALKTAVHTLVHTIDYTIYYTIHEATQCVHQVDKAHSITSFAYIVLLLVHSTQLGTLSTQ